MYVIGKPAEFASNQRPVRGQCQPHTKGWKLYHFSQGRSEVLYEGNYYTCREIQKAVANMSMEQARAKIAEEGEKLAIDLQETQLLGGSGKDEATRDKVLSDETPLDLPVIEEREVSASDATEIILREEMEDEARKHQRPADF